MFESLTRKRPPQAPAVQQRALPPELIPTRLPPAAPDPAIATINLKTVQSPALAFHSGARPTFIPTTLAYRSPETGGTQRATLAEMAGYISTLLAKG